MTRYRCRALALLVLFAAATSHVSADAARTKILFLGDNGHHKPAERFAQIEPLLKQRGIDVTYTDKMSDLNAATLKAYDGLLIYSNESVLAPEQEKAMLEYVRAGHGLIPVH